MPRKRTYPDNASRQKAYMERRKVLATNYDRLAKAITHALDAGRSHKLADNLPEEPTAMCDELVRRLSNVALVVFPPREKRVSEEESRSPE